VVDGEEDLFARSGKDSEAMVLLSIDWDLDLSKFDLFLPSRADEQFEVSVGLLFGQKEEVGAALVKLKSSFRNNFIGTIEIVRVTYHRT
jgi:hypothetical protein